uniref:Uncharacterized protein n=1 Tax=Amphilophus citrinellus TaxID=61819 RepID=A0A3Q0T5W8_AMPCI
MTCAALLFYFLHSDDPHAPSIHSTLNSFLLVEGLQLLSSSFIFFEPLVPLKKILRCDIISSPYTCCSFLSASDGIFPNWTRNFRLVCSSGCTAPLPEGLLFLPAQS